MISVAALTLLVSVYAVVEGFITIARTRDSVLIFGALLGIMLGSILFLVSIMWWLGWFGSPSPYLRFLP